MESFHHGCAAERIEDQAAAGPVGTRPIAFGGEPPEGRAVEVAVAHRDPVYVPSVAAAGKTNPVRDRPVGVEQGDSILRRTRDRKPASGPANTVRIGNTVEPPVSDHAAFVVNQKFGIAGDAGRGAEHPINAVVLYGDAERIDAVEALDRPTRSGVPIDQKKPAGTIGPRAR
jgi:hypothetical protein